MKSGYLFFLSVLICLLYSCSSAPKVCILQPHWDRDTADVMKIIERKTHCIPIQTYMGWNRCVGDCSDLKLNSKTKLYESKPWVRPRPYAYP